jgi:D-threo-aldose 1-dehydrogenase
MSASSARRLRGQLSAGPFAFGGAPLGGLFNPVSPQDAQGCLAAAWDSGIRYVDTAPHYGAGLSERRIGEFLATKSPADRTLSTKVGRILERSDTPADDFGFAGQTGLSRRFDFSRDGILQSFSDSLDRLGTTIDGVFLHDPDDHERQAVDEAWPVLAELRAQGVIRWAGAGMNGTEMLTRFVRETDMDVVLLAGRYTLLDQSALDDLLPACLDSGALVVVGGVYNSGILADPHDNATYDYLPAPAGLLDRARRIQAVCLRYDVPLAAASARFPTGHGAVGSVLIGSRSAEEVQLNAELAAVPIPADLWAELKAEGLLREDAPVPG